MPTYDYECSKGHRFEIFQKMSDDPVAECPECGARARRLISGGAGFLFKGEGFYITDYRSEDYKKKASAEPGAAPAAGGGSSSEGGSVEGGASKESAGSSKASDSASGEGSSASGSSSTSGSSSASES